MAMPRVRRHNLPPQLLEHLIDRVFRRNLSADQLGFLADWLYAEPEVPEGKWFKRGISFTRFAGRRVDGVYGFKAAPFVCIFLTFGPSWLIGFRSFLVKPQGSVLRGFKELDLFHQQSILSRTNKNSDP